MGSSYGLRVRTNFNDDLNRGDKLTLFTFSPCLKEGDISKHTGTVNSR